MVTWDRWARDVLTQAYPDKSEYIAALDGDGLRFDLKRLLLDRGNMKEASATDVRHWLIVRDSMALWKGTAPTRKTARLLWLGSPEFEQALREILHPFAGRAWHDNDDVRGKEQFTQLVEFCP